MHKNVELNIAHVTAAKLYVEDGGKWILHIWTDLSSADQVPMLALKYALDDLMGKETGYTTYVIHHKDSADASGA